MFNLLHSSTNQQLLEKLLNNQNENMDDFHCERKPPCATTKSTLFAVSKDEWQDTGKFIKNVPVCQKVPVELK